MSEAFVVNIKCFCKSDVWLSWLENKFGCHQCKWYYSHYCRTAEVPSPCVPCARVFLEKLTDPKWCDAQLLFVCPHSTVRCVVGAPVIDARAPSSESKCLSFFFLLILVLVSLHRSHQKRRWSPFGVLWFPFNLWSVRVCASLCNAFLLYSSLPFSGIILLGMLMAVTPFVWFFIFLSKRQQDQEILVYQTWSSIVEW